MDKLPTQEEIEEIMNREGDPVENFRKVMALFPRPKYDLFDFEETAEALQAVRRQFLNGEPLVWTGPNKLHHCVTATSFAPGEQFAKAGMEYHADQGRDFWDVFIGVAIQLGIHQGATLRDNESMEVIRRDLLVDVMTEPRWHSPKDKPIPTDHPVLVRRSGGLPFGILSFFAGEPVINDRPVSSLDVVIQVIQWCEIPKGWEE